MNKEDNSMSGCSCGMDHGLLDITKILADMPPEEEIYDLADFFKIFADSTRIRILCTLLYGEMCVSEIGDALDMTQSAISHQLRVLKQAKLVKNRREGKTIYYSLSDGHIISILSQGLEHIEE
jgi:ArsR family transcriptional regulator